MVNNFINHINTDHVSDKPQSPEYRNDNNRIWLLGMVNYHHVMIQIWNVVDRILNLFYI